MTYFGFLVCFVALPIGLLSLLVLRDARRNRGLPLTPGGSRPWFILGLLVIVALVYTTPWDNYLVATRVWWYEP